MRITAAAVLANGLTVSVPRPGRHCHILQKLPSRIARAVKPSEQGFLTDAGTFVGRVEALAIARKSGQVGGSGTDHKELFSEDLW